MATKLEKAYSKLERIKKEQTENRKAIHEEQSRIPFGQPNITGRPNIYRDVQRKYEKSRKLLKEEKQQEDRIQMLENVANFKEKNELLQDVRVVGKSEYATIGAKTSVNNLEYFRNQLIEMEEANEKAKAFNKTTVFGTFFVISQNSTFSSRENYS
ncbi:hypothetical protein [Listeria booriae]|uniref:Uncharacterized protein n=1 Tax=Listeria booriae TaxID=1552123 RepID=A0A842FJJ4_9LIST|nr:hypothetical protein [Listeria booriae]MBC2020800.1 hypothetical protein [Listeria booriae]MBC2067742.1 hypothetical protein [Listeria booriae]MBC2243146.1 hypothetical protein [Listeria booriae]